MTQFPGILSKDFRHFFSRLLATKSCRDVPITFVLSAGFEGSHNGGYEEFYLLVYIAAFP
jgi:hypothetical protein